MAQLKHSQFQRHLADLLDPDPAPPSPFEIHRAIQKANLTGFLVCDASNGVVRFLYRKKQRGAQRASILIARFERHAEIAAELPRGLLLTDEARNRIFETAVLSMLPGSVCLVSNSRVIISRLSFPMSHQLASWLHAFLLDGANLERGLDGRNHARCEATKRVDGSVKVFQKGITRVRSDRRAG